MRWTQILTIAIAILLLAACGARRAQVEPPRPTITPLPTFTLTPADAAVAVSSGQNTQQTQVQPAATAVPPTETPLPKAMVTIGTTQMNVRAGPSLLYQIIGQAYPGEEFEVTGKNPVLENWWEIKYRSEEVRGWVYSELVTPRDTQNVAVAAVIPAEPTRTPLPPPTATPIPAPTQPPAPQYPFSLASVGQCRKHDRVTTFKGIVCQRGGNPQEGCQSFGSEPKNDVCVHVAYYGPKNTKCSGCGAESYGAWGFTPFGTADEGKNLHDKVRGIPVEIYLVPCPERLKVGQRPTKDHSAEPQYAPTGQLSEKWTKTLNESMECTGITFKEN